MFLILKAATMIFPADSILNLYILEDASPLIAIQIWVLNGGYPA
jgi:hypothetical protein